MRTKFVLFCFMLHELTSTIHFFGYRPLLRGLLIGLITPFIFIAGGAMLDHGEDAFKSRRYLAALQSLPGLAGYWAASLMLAMLAIVWLIPGVNRPWIVGVTFGVLVWAIALDWRDWLRFDKKYTQATSADQTIIITAQPSD